MPVVVQYSLLSRLQSTLSLKLSVSYYACSIREDVPLLVLGVLAANDVDVFTTLSAHTLQAIVSVYHPFLLLIVSWFSASLSAANCPYLATITQLLDGTSDLHSSCLLESNQALCGRCDGSGE
jgi:hypothetical protein